MEVATVCWEFSMYLARYIELSSWQDLMSARPYSNPRCMCRLESLTRLTKLSQITQLGKFQSKDSHPDKNRRCGSVGHINQVHINCRLLFDSIHKHRSKQAVKALFKIAQPYKVFCIELVKIIYKLTSIICKWPLLKGTRPFDFSLHNHWEGGLAVCGSSSPQWMRVKSSPFADQNPT